MDCCRHPAAHVFCHTFLGPPGALPFLQQQGGGTMRTAFAATVIGIACLGAGTSGAANLSCDVAIVGGGPGGVHTAYKLTTGHLTAGPVCLFEKSDHLGGRVGNNNVVGQTSTPFVNGGVTGLNSAQTR